LEKRFCGLINRFSFFVNCFGSLMKRFTFLMKNFSLNYDLYDYYGSIDFSLIIEEEVKLVNNIKK
jgi:hypothetical protein